MRIAALLTVAGLIALTACSRNSPEEDPVVDNVVEEPLNAIPTASDEPETVGNNVAEPAPPPKISVDQQMLDDADATGLTARLPEDGSELPGMSENVTRPAQ